MPGRSVFFPVSTANLGENSARCHSVIIPMKHPYAIVGKTRCELGSSENTGSGGELGSACDLLGPRIKVQRQRDGLSVKNSCCLAENLSLVIKPTILCKASFTGSDALFWPPQELCTYDMHTTTQTHTHTYIFKKTKETNSHRDIFILMQKIGQ